MTDSNPPDDDPFAEFEDWLKDGPAGQWPHRRQVREYSLLQRRIIGSNQRLVSNPDEFGRLQRFTDLINDAPEGDRAEIRKKYSIRFDGLIFEDSLSFLHIEIPCDLDFSDCVFLDFSISQCKIYGNINIDRSIFNGRIFNIFKNDFCDGNLFADEIKVYGFGAAINYNKFTNGSMSLWKIFVQSEHISMDENELVAGDVILSAAQLPNCVVYLRDTRISRNLHIRNALLKGAHLNRTKVLGFLDTSDAIFHSIPDFRGMSYQGIPEVARMTVPPPRMSGWWPWSKAGDKEDVLKLRKLKAMAIEANDHEKDGEFFAYEMLAKRGWETKGEFGLLANWLYWVLSNYGCSYLVPLCWMTAGFVGFAAHYAWWLQRYVALPDAAHFAWLFSIKSSIPFLGSLFRFAPVPDGHESRFDTIYEAASGAGLNVDTLVWTGVTQSLVGGVFFFFLLLGLRNKFRLK